MITRHFIDVANPDGSGRRVHYRRAGNGPPLLMVHQSPRSSAEYTALMHVWGASFTCIAPDTPGFGQSAPLPGSPEIDDFADGIAALLDALGVARVAAYGLHSGGIILVTALRRHPDRFSALAVGGYAIWTPAEMEIFGEQYLPPFVPQAYGEHLTWLWQRVLEQSWFFPWFDVRNEARLPGAHADPARIDAVVREMLDAGDAYRAGYGAVLRAPRDIPAPDTVTPPVLITAYDGDPLQAHIDRLGPLPVHWAAHRVETAAEHEAASLAFLQHHASGTTPPLVEAGDEGFLHIVTRDFDGLIHWRGRQGDNVLHVHGPGRSVDLLDPAGFAIDVPGHGLSDGWPGDAPVESPPWQAVIRTAGVQFGITRIVYEAAPAGDVERLFPDLTPDRFGACLTRAWSVVRAAALFEPWYEVSAATARGFDPAALAPAALARAHRALLQATAARAYLTALRAATGDDHGDS